MRIKLINKQILYRKYNDKPAKWDEYEYLCPCVHSNTEGE